MNFELERYTLRRKVLKLLGASFHVYDEAGAVVGFCDQKAFKLREDIRVYTDESRSEELILVEARQIIDFSAAYDVVDSQAREHVGTLRRKGFSSMLRDSWEVLDEDGRPLAKVQEDSMALALVRRFLSNLVPQHFQLVDADGRVQADLRVRFNPFVYRLDVQLARGCELDRRLVLGTAILLAAIEGRQD